MSSSPSSSSSISALLGSGIAEPEAALHPFRPLFDVWCPVTVVLGTGSISVRDCLMLAPRSIVRLKQVAGEDGQVLVGDVAVARAEVVIVEDRTAVRITEVLKPARAEER
jgi:flagellar motor switch protein FliN/FliY